MPVVAFLAGKDNVTVRLACGSAPGTCKRLVPLPPGNGATAGTFLVDGMWQGTWQVRGQSLRIQPFTKLHPSDRDALLTEAAQLRAFVAPGAERDIILEEP